MGFKEFYTEATGQALEYNIMGKSPYHLMAIINVHNEQYHVSVNHKNENVYSVYCYDNAPMAVTSEDEKEKKKEVEFVNPLLAETVTRIVKDFLNEKISDDYFQGICFDMTKEEKLPLYNKVIENIQNTTYLHVATMNDDDSELTMTRD